MIHVSLIAAKQGLPPLPPVDIHSSAPALGGLLLPHNVLEDLLDCLTVEKAEAVFQFMESNIAIWTTV